MKICIIPNTNQPLNKDLFFNGVNKHTQLLIDALIDVENYELYLVVTNDSYKDLNININYITLDFSSNDALPLETIKGDRIRRASQLKKLVNNRNFDLILTENHYTTAKSFNAPCICFVHHTFDNPVCGKTSMFNINMMYNMKDFLVQNNMYIFVSKFQRNSFINGVLQILARINANEKLQKLFPNFEEKFKIPFEKTEVLYNALDLSHLDNDTLSENENKKESFALISIARCHPEKNLHNIIKFANNNKKELNIYCSTLKDQLKYKNKIQSLAEKSEFVTIHFDKPYNEIMLNLKNSKAVVLASNESLSYVGLEALTFGVKIIFLDFDSSLTEFEICTNETYRNCKSDDIVQDLTEFLKPKISDEKIQKFKNDLSIEVYRNNLIKHIEKIAKKSSNLDEW